MTKLSVNINKIATLRNARGGNNPDVIKAALDIERFGASGITVHPRPDERHIRYADVKELGKMMVTEHSKASSDLLSLAESKQISIPTTLTDAGLSAQKDLKEVDSKDFNKKYVDKMVSGHKDAISKYEDASTDAKDADIRNLASTTLPILRQHLDKFIVLQDKYEKR